MKVFKTIGLFVAGVMSMFSGSPNIPHGIGGCCAECALQKEDDDKIEMIIHNDKTK
jgi:hypothetical protein